MKIAIYNIKVNKMGSKFIDMMNQLKNMVGNILWVVPKDERKITLEKDLKTLEKLRKGLLFNRNGKTEAHPIEAF